VNRDDRHASRSARALGIGIRGTLGLVILAKQIASIPAARPVVEHLRRVGLFLPAPTFPKPLGRKRIRHAVESLYFDFFIELLYIRGKESRTAAVVEPLVNRMCVCFMEAKHVCFSTGAGRLKNRK
jgi:hypothetical protein